MSWFRKNPEDQYKPNEALEHSFKAYITKGNRNIVSRDVMASKRFRIDDGTYIIKPDCIRRKIIDGKVTSVSYYRENNPNPYNFKKENTGIDVNELDHTFAEDFYEILIDLAPESKIFYFFILVTLNLGLSLTFLCSIILKLFILKG